MAPICHVTLILVGDTALAVTSVGGLGAENIQTSQVSHQLPIKGLLITVFKTAYTEIFLTPEITSDSSTVLYMQNLIH